MSDQPRRAGLPRAMRPFRHRDYRFLVASMAVSLFASGMWIVAAGLAGDRARRRPDRARPWWPPRPASACCSACCSAGWPPTGCPGAALLIVVEVVRVGTAAGGRAARGHRGAAAVAPGGDRVPGRRGRGVLLPGLHRAAAHPAARRRAARRQRRGGHAAPGRPAGASARRWPGVRGRRVRPERGDAGGRRACYAVALLALLAMRAAARSGRGRGRLGAAASSARASATCSAPAGCSPRWRSPACTCWC